ncbi:B12-binding domain-containing radical SAM protein [Pendulispora rubella]|uniref:B12-binding domain-containing radical SAM protein n=1 Tax=Pendulispora rubella TaxID=2741070 RepID=A0ABZ2LKU1_9BACT
MSDRNLRLKPNLLCIVPPYPLTSVPLGPAALLGYLKANGCHDFDFLDLRLWVPYSFAPTHQQVGAFGETFVLDVPELPLVLQMLRNFEEGKPLIGPPTELFERYCAERVINSVYLHNYLTMLDRFFERVFSQVQDLRFIGFSCWTTNFLATMLAAAHLKRRKSPPFIVVGGPQVTESIHCGQLGLASGLFDAVAQSEGEETLLCLYEEFCQGNGEVTKPVPGTMQRDPETNGFRITERKPLRMKELPLPSFDEMSILSYGRPYDDPKYNNLRILPFQLSRGCTDKCSFCSEWVFWRTYRVGPTDRAVEQLKELKSKYNADGIWFSDSLLNGKMSRLVEFAETAKKQKLDVLWGGYMRADMTPDTASLIFEAGCRNVFLGIESMSDETLEVMRKRRAEAHNINALRSFLQTGMVVQAGLIAGFPGDTRHRFLHTARVLQEIQQEFVNLNVNTEPFAVMPGQPIFQELGKYDLHPRGWAQDYLDIAPKYRFITNDVYCSVDGPNQGIDRLGEFRIGLSLGDAVAGLNYGRKEPLGPLRFQLDYVYQDVALGTIKSTAAMTYGAILTKAEQAEFDQGHMLSTFQGQSSIPMLEHPVFTDMLGRLEAAHVVPPRRTHPGIYANSYEGSLSENAGLTLSPFVIARVLEAGGVLLVVNFISSKCTVLPASIAWLVEFLAGTPRYLDEIRARAKDLDVQDDGWMKTLDDLRERGLVVVNDHRTDSPAAPFRRRISLQVIQSTS